MYMGLFATVTLSNPFSSSAQPSFDFPFLLAILSGYCGLGISYISGLLYVILKDGVAKKG